MILDDCFYSKQQFKRERKLDATRKNLNKGKKTGCNKKKKVKFCCVLNVILKEKGLKSKWGLDDHGQSNQGQSN